LAGFNHAPIEVELAVVEWFREADGLSGRDKRSATERWIDVELQLD